MGYFSNGTEEADYEEKYCKKCYHDEDCPILLAHLIHNSDECNNKNSILHLFIPRDKDGYNEKCKMLTEKD